MQNNLYDDLKNKLDHMTLHAEIENVGTVDYIGDGIARVVGLDSAMYGERLRFDNGTEGMVQSIKEDGLGVIVLGDYTDLSEGDPVRRCHELMKVGVGSDLLGRVVNPMGQPIDGGLAISFEAERSLEYPAPSIMSRKKIDRPLQTGIKAIDALVPIGKGQRELIIGDRKTGKTTLAVDSILNQAGRHVLCVYVAIGQKSSTVKQVEMTLRQQGAMAYTFIVAATASQPSCIQYIAPYAATAMAEHFMYQGQDVLIVYDDLSKHAAAYREMSLLLKRPPGREAYPGDIFYAHARLLERAGQLNDSMGGGSLTALPIIETQAADLSAYIPTNVISITDGQIFLEDQLFLSGVRPAINAGLSVSRVGGSAQLPAMKAVASHLRIDLAAFRELEAFSQFGADLDEWTKKKLTQGQKTVELLKQPAHQPLNEHFQIIILYALSQGHLASLRTGQMADFEAFFWTFLQQDESKPAAWSQAISDKETTNLDLLIKQAVETFKQL